ncbi:hypothetical protein L209DRAFT_750849 [Thermothelomyces heterothallicus CBS 203.75]
MLNGEAERRPRVMQLACLTTLIGHLHAKDSFVAWRDSCPIGQVPNHTESEIVLAWRTTHRSPRDNSELTIDGAGSRAAGLVGPLLPGTLSTHTSASPSKTATGDSKA